MAVEFSLVVEPASGGRYEHRVGPGSYVLGRDEDGCDIAILSPEVSRHHVRLGLAAGQCTVEDLGSTAGTLKDGEPLAGEHDFPLPLEISLGTARLSVSGADVVEVTFDSSAEGEVTAAPSSAITFNQGRKANPTPSTDAGHYTKGREIARGGMGAILEANDRMLGRTVAMKVVLEERASEDARMRFIREATVLGQLEHPNIIPIHELGKDDDGNFFYAMKMVEGRTLQAIINDLKKGDRKTVEEFTLDRLLTVFRKVCDAIAFAHSKGIVHRDLKPENVMVGAFGEVLVMDWGLAKILKDVAQTADELGQQQQLLANSGAPVSQSALPTGFEELTDSQMRGSSEDLTMDGAVMGSPQYMPPEQAEGRVADIDEKSDIYSLGGILYAILTLRPPIRGKTVIQVLDNVKSGNITPPTEYNPGGTEARQAAAKAVKDPGTATALPHCPGGRVPAALSAVTMKAMAQKSSARYLSVARLTEEIDSFQHGHATTAEDISWMGEFLLLIKRNKAVTLTGFVAFILLVGLGAYSFSKVVKERNFANKKQKEAIEAQKEQQIEADNARASEAAAKRDAYASDMLLMKQAWDSASMTQLDALLERNRSLTNLHGFEWNYWTRQADQRRTLTLESDRTEPFVGPFRGRISFHPDGIHVAVADGSRSAAIWNIQTGTKKFELGGHGYTRSVAICQKGERIATAGADGTVKIWDFPSGKLIKTIRVGIGQVDCLAFGADGQQVAARGRPRNGVPPRTQVWNLDTDDPPWSLPSLPENQAWAAASFFSADGGLLALKSTRGIQIWDVTERSLKHSIPGSTRAFAFSPDGLRIAIANERAGTLRIHDIKTGGEIQLIEAHSPGKVLLAVDYSPNGRFIASSASDNSIRVFDAKTGSVLRKFYGDKKSMGAISFDQASMRIASLSLYQSVQIWDLPANMETFRARRPGVLCIDFHPTEPIVAMGDSGGRVSIYDLNSRLNVSQITAGKSAVRDIAFNSDGSRFVTGGDDRTLRVWDTRTGALIKSQTHNHAIERICHHPTDSLVAFCSGNDLLFTWDPQSSVKPKALSGGGVKADDVAFSPDGAQLLSAHPDGTLMVWDTTTLNILAKLKSKGNRVHSARLATDGFRIVSAHTDGILRIRDRRTGEIVSTFPAHDGGATRAQFMFSGDRVASVGHDGMLRIRDTRSGREILTYFFGNHTTSLNMAVSKDERFIGISWGSFGGVILDARTWTPELRTLNHARGALELLTPAVSSLADLRDQIQSSRSLGEDVQEQALEWSERFWNARSQFGH